jgi:hypothetical protein
MSRVGIVVECGPDGLEVHMCRRICKLLREEHAAELEEQIFPMDNKGRLLRECALVARNLFADGYERVIILWDERPAATDLCWSRERKQILAALRAQELARRPVFLVCIEREFESWLLFDARLLSAVIPPPNHPKPIKAPRNPHRLENPKGTMMSLFRKHSNRPYVDVQAARRFATALQDLARLRRCATFRRFVQKLTGTAL